MASKVAGSDFDEQELEAGEGGRSSIIDKLARATEAESGKDRESGSDPLSQLSKESPRDGTSMLRVLLIFMERNLFQLVP